MKIVSIPDGPVRVALPQGLGDLCSILQNGENLTLLIGQFNAPFGP